MKYYLLTPAFLLYISVCFGQYNYGLDIGEHDVKVEGKLNLSTRGNSVIIGENAGMNDRAFAPNVYIGENAGMSSINSVSNTIIGANAGMRNSTNQNTFIGTESGRNTHGASAFSNTFLGCSSGYRNERGNSNVYIGKFSGGGLRHGNNNVCIGSLSGPETSGNSFDGHQNVYIGYLAGSSIGPNESNRLVIETGNQVNPLIYGEFDNDLLKVNGTLHISETAKLEPQSEAPTCGSGDMGSMYADTRGVLYFCNGTSWRSVQLD